MSRTPVYPLFIAFIYGVFGQYPLVIAGAQVLISALTVGPTYLLGIRLLPQEEARVGGLLLSFSVGSLVYSMYILTETLFTVLLLSVTYTLAANRRKAQKRWYMSGGVLAGLAILSRPIGLFYPLVAALLITFVHRGRWRQGISAALLFLSIATLVVGPWLLRNYVLIGLPTLSTITSHNLLFYNAVSLEADLRGVGQGQARAEMAERVEEELARRGEPYSEASRLRLYNGWSRQIILAHPWRYLYVHLKNDLNSLLPNITQLMELLLSFAK